MLGFLGRYSERPDLENRGFQDADIKDLEHENMAPVNSGNETFQALTIQALAIKF